MPLNWPTPSFIGEQYTYLGNTWVWDGQVWKSLGEYIPGPTGPTGPTGSIGPTGPGGASGSYSYIVSNTTQTNGGTASANLITYDSNFRLHFLFLLDTFLLESNFGTMDW